MLGQSVQEAIVCQTRHRTCRARRFAASCAGPGRHFLIWALCCDNCSSSFLIFSSSLQQNLSRSPCIPFRHHFRAQTYATSNWLWHQSAICKPVSAATYTLPLESSLPVASSRVGGLGLSFLAPNILFMPRSACATSRTQYQATLLSKKVQVSTTVQSKLLRTGQRQAIQMWCCSLDPLMIARR